MDQSAETPRAQEEALRGGAFSALGQAKQREIYGIPAIRVFTGFPIANVHHNKVVIPSKLTPNSDPLSAMAQEIVITVIALRTLRTARVTLFAGGYLGDLMNSPGLA